jgi:hypothetical protein
MTEPASITVAADFDLPTIVRAAGGDPTQAAYVEGVLHVAGVSQAKLEKALENYDPAKVERPSPPDPLEKFKAYLAENPDVAKAIGVA